MRIQTGDNVGIGGFIITGTAPKHVLIRAIGPSLAQFGVPDPLADPVLELHGPGRLCHHHKQRLERRPRAGDPDPGHWHPADQ